VPDDRPEPTGYYGQSAASWQSHEYGLPELDMWPLSIGIRGMQEDPGAHERPVTRRWMLESDTGDRRRFFRLPCVQSGTLSRVQVNGAAERPSGALG
jgi:hypothetical protein